MNRRTRFNRRVDRSSASGASSHAREYGRSHVQDHDLEHADPDLDQQPSTSNDDRQINSVACRQEMPDIDLDLIPQCQIQNYDVEYEDSEYVHNDKYTWNAQKSQPCNLSASVSSKSCSARKSTSCDNSSSLSSEQCKITALPDDVLFVIFSYLQPKELCSACCTCRRFQLLASKDSVWSCHARRNVVVKVPSSSRLCPLKELCRIAPNWKLGRFKESFAVRHRTRLIPWVHKYDDSLWFSTGNSIRHFKVYPSGYLREEKDRCLFGMEDDATRFLQKNDIVISGCRNGSVYGWETSGNPIFCYKQVHRSDTQCVDFTDTIIISGSRDTTCKILPLYPPPDHDDPVVRSFDAGERVWSLRISPCERFFAAGLAGCLDDPPVIMWDIDSGECIGQLSMNHRRGAGVLDLKFESQHELLTCGYDTFVRLWDLRTQTCVAQWEEPYDSALYCIESDGENTFFVGTARHGMVRLWDKRMTEPVQAYYSNNRNSPVYSLAMNYGHLYLALDMGLNVMDFTAWKTNSHTVGPSTSPQHSTSTGQVRPRHSYRR